MDGLAFTRNEQVICALVKGVSLPALATAASLAPTGNGTVM
jgi:hypothetical protein